MSASHSGTGVDLAALADRVVDMVGGRGEAAVTVARVREGLTRFANSSIHQNVGDERLSVTLDVVAAGRPASVTTSSADDDSLLRLVDSALESAAVQPIDEAWPGLAPPAAMLAGRDAHVDRPTADAGPGSRADIVAAFVAAGDGLESAGYCETSFTAAAFSNSAGQRVESASTSAAIDGIQRAPTSDARGHSDGCGSVLSGRIADLDGAGAGRAAAETARSGTRTAQLAPGRYEVVLEPRCVAYMLDFLTVFGFNAKAVEEGQSFVSYGERQFDENLWLWDDAADPRHVGLGFDAEGTPKRRSYLVERGHVTGLTHDRRTAARAGEPASSTGHALPGGAASGPIATNVFLEGATTVPVSDLIAGVERGLLVKDFWYTRVLDPKTLVVTGLTRNGVFLVEHGEVGPAVGNLRFTQSPAAAFGPGQVLGVGDDAVLAPGGLHLSWHHTPSLRLAGWQFTGNAEG